MMTLTARYSEPEITAALQLTGAEYLMESPVVNLSGGEFQRVMLARALLRNPELLVLDEPVQGVDYLGETEMYRLIGQIRDQYGCAVLMVSHDLHVVMASTDRVVCLDHHICCQGHPADVSAHPEYLRLFGQGESGVLAVYSHHHDHQHNLSGEIEACDGGHH
jgi:zinc transport system ATP-binding protein